MFKPESGAWPANSEIVWEVAPSWVDKDSDYFDEVSMVGAFSTSDWLHAGEPPTGLELTGELTEFVPADYCGWDERIVGDFTLSGHSIEPGGLVELVWWKDNDEGELTDTASLTEEAVSTVAILEESGNFSLDLGAVVFASEGTFCFTARVFSADGSDYAQVNGPCLEWGGGHSGGKTDCGGAGCSSSNGPGSPAAAWLGLLGLMAFSRRRSQ